MTQTTHFETALYNLTGMVFEAVQIKELHEAYKRDQIERAAQSIPDMSKVRQIKTYISETHKIEISVMESKWRKREAVFARQLAMVLIDGYTRLSLKQIGREFGGRDHSTVIHSKQTIRDLCQTDKQIKKLYNHHLAWCNEQFGRAV